MHRGSKIRASFEKFREVLKGTESFRRFCDSTTIEQQSRVWPVIQQLNGKVGPMPSPRENIECQFLVKPSSYASKSGGSLSDVSQAQLEEVREKGS